MADEVQEAQGSVSRRALRDKEVQEHREKVRQEQVKLARLVNSVAGTDDGLELLRYVVAVTGANDAGAMQQAVTSAGAVDPFLAGYTMGRKSLGEFIQGQLTPDNFIKTLKRQEP